MPLSGLICLRKGASSARRWEGVYLLVSRMRSNLGMRSMWNRFSRRDFFKLAALPALPVSPLLAAADPTTLKIRSVEAHVLKIGRRSDIVCARVETAEGIHGWGEGTT